MNIDCGFSVVNLKENRMIMGPEALDIVAGDRKAGGSGGVKRVPESEIIAKRREECQWAAGWGQGREAKSRDRERRSGTEHVVAVPVRSFE